MDNEFYTLLTDRGMAKIASALADKKQLHLQKMAVGDGGGQYYEPIASQTKLRHEVWRGEMNTLTVAPNNPNWLIAELVLPEDVGGWYVREVGVFDDEGELIAIGKFPESYKPLLPGGCGKQVCIRLIMEVSNTTAVTLTVDPSIVLATRDYVDTRLDEHEHSTNHPDATLTQKGFTQLSNATDSTSTTEAATPSAVKAAYDKASAAAPANHSHYQFFTANGTFTVPDGVTQVFVEMLGGGGGGGGGGHTSNTDGLLYCSGGNAGKSGEPEIAIVPVIAGNNYPVTVGAGGASGAGGVLPNSNPTGNVVQVGQAGNSGINGGNSIFIDVVANGGAGGAGGIVQSRIPLSGFNQLDSISGGNAETTFFGKGGTGAVLSNGSNASGYGAGGGGGASVNSLNIALSGYAGGRGSSGFVKISW
ncbi:TPA: phage tail protein [Salmonella enterica]|nr:phage tail protein [Salmonella enterica]HDI4420107.1 phage tail protein [Salmonella enterica]